MEHIVSVRKIFVFLGTTAELIKLAPVIQEIKKRNIDFTVIATGQNDIRFEEYNSILKGVVILKAVTPKSKESSVLAFVIWAIRTFFSLLLGMRSNFKGLNKSNSYFIIHGDTVSSLMGSLVASIYGLKLVHIESGLRSFHFLEPFPEEICRYIISRLADIHFCPNEWSKNNLKGFKGSKVNTYENTLIEAYYSAIAKTCHNSLVKSLTQSGKKYFVMVIHRQEHVVYAINIMHNLLTYVFSVVPTSFQCVFLVHDQSAKFIQELHEIITNKKMKNFITINRLPYPDFMHLLLKSEFVITDGGSNQEELYYMGKPCLLMRKHTERIEGLGKNVVLGNNDQTLIRQFIDSYSIYKRKQIRINKRPSAIIVDYLFTYDSKS